MKGLLLKEFYSLIGLRNGLFILLVIVAFSGWNEMSDFVYTYIPMVLMMLAISSFSYDEYYHWDSYALTMPLDRKTLVQGKYVFVLLLFFASLLISWIIAWIFGGFQGNQEWLPMFLSVSVSSGLFLAIYVLLIPIVIRFGAEKGRYAYISFFLIGFVLLLAIVKIVPLTELTMFLKQNAIAIGGSLPVLLILLVGISYQVSLHWYMKKEF